MTHLYEYWYDRYNTPPLVVHKCQECGARFESAADRGTLTYCGDCVNMLMGNDQDQDEDDNEL